MLGVTEIVGDGVGEVQVLGGLVVGGAVLHIFTGATSQVYVSVPLSGNVYEVPGDCTTVAVFFPVVIS
jgi:hypothetical protein